MSLLCLILLLTLPVLLLDPLGTLGLGILAGIFLCVFLSRRRHGIDEAFAGHAVVIHSIQACLEQGQVLVADVEPAVVTHPVGEVVDADEAHVVLVHVREQALSVELQLVSLVVHFVDLLEKQAHQGSKLLQPGALEQVLLLDCKVRRCRLITSAGSFGLESGNPLSEVNRTVLIIIHELNEAGLLSQLDVVIREHLSQLTLSQFSILVDVEKGERIFKRESLVVEKSGLCILYSSICANQKFDKAQEHKVLDLTLFLGLFVLLLLFAYLLLFSLDLLFDFGSLLGSNSLFFISLLLALSRSQVVDGLRDLLAAALG